MAALNVVLNGTFTVNDQTAPGTFNGQMSYSDVGVGGGPVFPPVYPAHPIAPGGERPAHPIAPGGERPAHPIAPGGERPAHPIAPGGEHPEHPIVLPPYEPGGPPVQIWPRPGHPAHPIVIPEPPTEPPAGTQPGGGKPPPPGGGWGYHPEYGWGYFPGPTQAGPKTA